MTSSDNNQKKSGIALIIVGAVLVAISLIAYISNSDTQAVAQSEEPSAPIADATTASQHNEESLQAALAPRTLGSNEAPVKVIEYASLSCGHCAHFHTEILPEFKKKFIDTNQVQLIFSEFPLNNAALEATMVARCLPADQYVDFTGTLFENIEDWAYQQNHLPGLRKMAEKFGMTNDAVAACLKQTPLREAIVTRMRAAAKQWQIGSTPSFLIANDTVITGAQNVEAFAPAIEKALAENAAETVEESTETQTTTEAAE